MRIGPAFAAVAALIASPAFAGESWVCTQPGVPDGKPVDSYFEVSGSELIGTYPSVPRVQLRYTIQRNDDWGIVATWSITAPRGRDGGPYLSARTITINRHSHEMAIANIEPGGAGQAGVPIYGTCRLRNAGGA